MAVIGERVLGRSGHVVLRGRPEFGDDGFGPVRVQTVDGAEHVADRVVAVLESLQRAGGRGRAVELDGCRRVRVDAGQEAAGGFLFVAGLHPGARAQVGGLAELVVADLVDVDDLHVGPWHGVAVLVVQVVLRCLGYQAGRTPTEVVVVGQHLAVRVG